MSLYLGSEKVENVTAQITLPVEPSDDLPLADGTASAGTSKKFSRADHVHPISNNAVRLDDTQYTNGAIDLRIRGSGESIINSLSFNDGFQIGGNTQTTESESTNTILDMSPSNNIFFVGTDYANTSSSENNRTTNALLFSAQNDNSWIGETQFTFASVKKGAEVDKTDIDHDSNVRSAIWFGGNPADESYTINDLIICNNDTQSAIKLHNSGDIRIKLADDKKIDLTENGVHKIYGVADPEEDYDAVNKQYVDTSINEINNSVIVAKTFVGIITYSNSKFICDKTFSQIQQAYNAGQTCILKYNYDIYYLVTITSSEIEFCHSNITIQDKFIFNSNSNITYRSTLLSALPTARKITLTTSGWSNNQQTVTCTGVSSSATSQEIRVMPADASKTSAYVSCGVSCVAQASNKLTFACDTVPTTAIDVYVVMQSLNFQS